MYIAKIKRSNPLNKAEGFLFRYLGVRVRQSSYHIS